MNTVTQNTDNRLKLKPWHFAAGVAGACVPFIGELGNTFVEMRGVNKLEKLPLKDSFVKAIENKGKNLQNFNSLKGFSPKGLGATWFTVWTTADILFFTWLAKAAEKHFSKK